MMKRTDLRMCMMCLSLMGIFIMPGWRCTSGGNTRSESLPSVHLSDSTPFDISSTTAAISNSKNTLSSVANGKEKFVAMQADSFPDCNGRVCDVEASVTCTGQQMVCDFYRNKCIPLCAGPDCCKDVNCPPGTVCVPGTGRCGKPAGEGCYDMGPAWWTGRDVAQEVHSRLDKPMPVTFQVENSGTKALYFTSTIFQSAKFDLFATYCGKLRRMEIPENHFCPTLCPPSGPPMEVDCARPPDRVARLRPGQEFTLTWGGEEQVANRRICLSGQEKRCMVNFTSLAGTYTAQICYSYEMEGGTVVTETQDQFTGAKVKGEPHCEQFSFQYPSNKLVQIRVGQ